MSDRAGMQNLEDVTAGSKGANNYYVMLGGGGFGAVGKKLLNGVKLDIPCNLVMNSHGNDPGVFQNTMSPVLQSADTLFPETQFSGKNSILEDGGKDQQQKYWYTFLT